MGNFEWHFSDLHVEQFFKIAARWMSNNIDDK